MGTKVLSQYMYTSAHAHEKELRRNIVAVVNKSEDTLGLRPSVKDPGRLL